MLISNPLANPLLPPVIGTLGGIFLATLLALFIRAHGRWRALPSSHLFLRWRTWTAIAPVYTLAILAGPLPIALLAAMLAVQGIREYARLTALGAADRRVLIAGALLLPTSPLIGAPSALHACLVALALASTVPALLAQDVQGGPRRAALVLFGLLYLPAALTHLVLIGQHPNGGSGLLLTLGLAVALSDVAAFTLGSLVGRHPLAPRLSPSKTWEGVLGNLVGAGLGVLLLSPVVPSALPAVVVLVVTVGAVWGDLLESLLKRSGEVKDSGDWLPGFGGLLDRIDSLLLVLPLTYVLLEVLT